MTSLRGDAVVYTELAMFSIGSHLFKPDDFTSFHLSMRNGSLFDSLLRAEHLQIYRGLIAGTNFIVITARFAANVMIRMRLRMVSDCNMYLRVLQRAIRRFCRIKRQALQLAVVMALHPRLGASSMLASLGVDMLCCCARVV